MFDVSRTDCGTASSSVAIDDEGSFAASSTGGDGAIDGTEDPLSDPDGPDEGSDDGASEGASEDKGSGSCCSNGKGRGPGTASLTPKLTVWSSPSSSNRHGDLPVA